MHKIIHSKFEIDLSDYEIAIVEETHWFSDKFFTKYSFPFNIYITDALADVLSDFMDENNQILTTVFNVKYVLGNDLEDAILEIETQEGPILNATIRYGLDELPNFSKKLNELPLEVTTITDIFAHAKTIISQTWPAVNYNYPQIHTDKYDITDATWATFLQIINNYDGSNFLANTFSPIDNKNIIQPVPYLLHILTQGFLDAGYTLKGDVLTHALVKKICVFADLDYFSFDGIPITALVNKADYTSLISGIASYNINVNLGANNQKFRVTGKVRIFPQFNLETYKWDTAYAYIIYKSSTLFGGSSGQDNVTVINVDFEFTTDGEAVGTQVLNLKTSQGYDRILDALFDLKIERINDVGANEVHIKNEVDLTKVVPNIDFGSLVSIIKNLLNITIDITGHDIYMNFIENNINYNDAVDLRTLQTKSPKKTFESNKSFLLKFKDVDNAPTPYLPLFQNAQLSELSNKKVDDNTNIIEISALPLPNKTVGTVNTAFAFDHGGDSSVYFLLYNGLNADSLNYASDPAELLIPNLHQLFWNKWFTFRTNSIPRNWKFKMFEEDLRDLLAKRKVFGYGQYHIIKTLNKTQIKRDLFDVDMDTESLK